ncbi:unnamed protein product [Clonostachys byssicola]|uniref:C2H2-type domain-containing protein n=1 Tax=Clonostachys byssicola TaxID=160290 RepID=A0A9N9TV07_9HYPO|nr:unnamed protein product [Clonostachys byssicola]
MRLLFEGAEDTEFVQWASHSSVKLIVPASSGNGWLLRTARKFFEIPSDSGYGSSIQTGPARTDDIASRLEPSETSGYESSESGASTAIATREGPGDDSDDITDMATALYHLRFGSMSLPSQESTALTDSFDIQHERSVSESAASYKSVGSDQSVSTKNSFQSHMRTLFGDIDDFVSKYPGRLFSQINEFANAADEAQNLLYTGPGGENYYGSVSGSGSSPNSDQANSNSTGLISHIPGSGNRGNDNDDDGSPNQNLNWNMHQPHHSGPREFACPFYKRDHENRELRDCSKKRFLQFSRLLEHIKRAHTLNKLQCDRCLSQFTSEHQYDLHVGSTSICEMLNHGKIGQATYGVLSSRSLYRGMDPEKRWIQTYCLLFPSEGTVPSPYYEDRCHYPLSWDDAHLLDYIRMRFPSENESTVPQLDTFLQYPPAENSLMDENIRKIGEVSEDFNGPRPTQPADHITEPEILNQDNPQLSHPYNDTLSREGTLSTEGFDCGQWEPVLGRYPNKTKDGLGNICVLGSPPPENTFSHVAISETCDTHLSSPSIRSSGHESSEQHQNLNHEFTLHQLATAVQNE